MTLPLDELIARLKELDRHDEDIPLLLWVLLVRNMRDISAGKEDSDAIAQLRTLLPEIIERLEKKGSANESDPNMGSEPEK